jgi:hypothetical protein
MHNCLKLCSGNEQQQQESTAAAEAVNDIPESMQPADDPFAEIAFAENQDVEAGEYYEGEDGQYDETYGGDYQGDTGTADQEDYTYGDEKYQEDLDYDDLIYANDAPEVRLAGHIMSRTCI